MTRARSRVCDWLAAADKPVTAQQAALALKDDCDQATVYRAMHWLEDHGMAESFVLHCPDHGTERYWISPRNGHRHWFHCRSCHTFLDLGACTLEGLMREWQDRFGLAVESHALQVTGLCAQCRTRY